MKKRLILFSALFLVALFTVSASAKAYTTDYKNPNKNLAEIQTLYITPIVYPEELQLDDFDKLRIQAIMEKELKKLPLPYEWVQGSEASPLDHSRANLVIQIKKFDRDFYETTGHYEEYVSGPSFYGGYVWRSHRSSRWSSGPYIGMNIPIAPRVSGRYVDSELYSETHVEARFTLQSMDGKEMYWVFNQERVEAPRKQVITPDKDLKKITEDGIDHLKDAYKKDLKMLKKASK